MTPEAVTRGTNSKVERISSMRPSVTVGRDMLIPLHRTEVELS
jgi:hypothetical protein